MLILSYTQFFHIQSSLLTVLIFSQLEQSRYQALTYILLSMHNIEIMAYKQMLPVRKLKENTLLPPVVPSIIFISLLPLLRCSHSKCDLLEALVLLQDLCTSEGHWSLPRFNLVIEADLAPPPLVVRRQETTMAHVAMLTTIF